MKRVKYVGEIPVDLATVGVHAEPGDTVTVPDWWDNPQFIEVKEKKGGVTDAPVE